MPEQLKVVGTEISDMLVSIDPGRKNMGMAIFLRSHKEPSQIKLETGVQLLLADDYKWALAPSYVLGIAYKIAADFNQVYFKLDSTVPARIQKIAVVIEQASAKNTDHKNFIFGMQACIFAMLPWSPFKTYLTIISPKTVQLQLKIPLPAETFKKTKQWITRKAYTQKIIENGIGFHVSRHDTSDAIALGIASLMAKKVQLSPTPFSDDCLDLWFDSSPSV